VGFEDRRLVVFVRAPRLGQVKRRLAATLGDAAALAIYRDLVHSLITLLKPLHPVELRYTPDDALDEVRGWAQPGWSLSPQGAGDLGARMQAAFVDAFAAGKQRVLLIGSDCPTLRLSDLNEAWTGLKDNDVVLGPARDGGYWLIGLRQARPKLFQSVAWSTKSVLRETLDRAREAGLRVTQLRELADIDTEHDWREFQHAQFQGAP
jgi:uncharacterized protein